jgi:hypothetical protein
VFAPSRFAASPRAVAPPRFSAVTGAICPSFWIDDCRCERSCANDAGFAPGVALLKKCCDPALRIALLFSNFPEALKLARDGTTGMLPVITWLLRT